MCDLSSQWVVYGLVLARPSAQGRNSTMQPLTKRAPGTVQCDVKACSTPVCEQLLVLRVSTGLLLRDKRIFHWQINAEGFAQVGSASR